MVLSPGFAPFPEGQRRSIPPPMMACVAHALSMLRCEIHLIKKKAAKERGGQ
jgi:hypothetical protein